MEKSQEFIEKAIHIYGAHCAHTGGTFRAPDRSQCRFEKQTGIVRLIGYDGALIESVSIRIRKVIKNQNQGVDQEVISQAIEDFRKECQRKGVPFNKPVPEMCRVDHLQNRVLLYSSSHLVGCVIPEKEGQPQKVITSY